jgi:hypothetical protein
MLGAWFLKLEVYQLFLFYGNHDLLENNKRPYGFIDTNGPIFLPDKEINYFKEV